MPSDPLLLSTGLATYPVPPQRGQSFGSTYPPQLPFSFSPNSVSGSEKRIVLRKPNRLGVGRSLSASDEFHAQRSESDVFI